MTSSDRTPVERQTEWLATSRGHLLGDPADRGGVIIAHADSTAATGSQEIRDRRAREEHEDNWMAPGATRAFGAGERGTDIEPDPLRTCFERDRDRILHSSPFRRLQGKTQVFLFPDDHVRNRLAHSLEVAQVAAAIARALRLNVALAEAIALGHDCGHGPGGHASEDALSSFVDGGYDHAVWGADVTLRPYNLCVQTLDGIRNHSWSRPAPTTPKGEVVSWADRIAYVCHDFEDAVRQGLVNPDQLPPLVRSVAGTSRGQQLGAFINGMVIAAQQTGRVGMISSTAEALTEFRRFNYEAIYRRPDSDVQADRVIQTLQALANFYIGELERFEPVIGNVFATLTNVSETENRNRQVVAYVGGMTDKFAVEEAIRHLDLHVTQLPIKIA